jgi:hypothetical protein
LTDPVWALKERLRYRVPLWLQSQTVEAVASIDDREVKRMRAASIPAKRVEWSVENALGVRMTS